MKDFDSIKEMWQQQPPAAEKNMAAPVPGKKAADIKTTLLRQQLRGAILLILTAVYITWIGFFSSIHFKLIITYIAISMMLALILVQAAICFYTYKKIKIIDDTLAPAIHLKQWEAYYTFRKKQVRLNLPVYYIFLNAAFGLYFIEVLGGRSFLWNTVAIAIYTGWMLFSYFVLGRRALAKEEKRIKTIMDNLKELSGQFSTAD